MRPDTLAELREIHLPPPVSWWPPAPGWWLLAGLLVAFALLLAVWWRRRHRQGALARQARAELARVRRHYQEKRDPRVMARELSRLLRRVAISCFPREQVAGLTGEAWLEFLDRALGERESPFRQGVGRVLVEAPYAVGVRIEAEPLLELVARWIEKVTRGCGHA